MPPPGQEHQGTRLRPRLHEPSRRWSAAATHLAPQASVGITHSPPSLVSSGRLQHVAGEPCARAERRQGPSARRSNGKRLGWQQACSSHCQVPESICSFCHLCSCPILNNSSGTILIASRVPYCDIHIRRGSSSGVSNVKSSPGSVCPAPRCNRNLATINAGTRFSQDFPQR